MPGALEVSNTLAATSVYAGALVRPQSRRLKLFDEHTGDDENDVEDSHTAAKELAQLPATDHDADHSSEDHSQQKACVEHQVRRPWHFMLKLFRYLSWYIYPSSSKHMQKVSKSD